MITVKNLSLLFGVQLVLDDISFNINSRERIGLVGRNGSGKTTLFNLLCGKLTPDKGTLSIPRNYTVGYLEQHIKFTQKTVLEEGCRGLRPEYIHDEWKVEKILTGLGFSEEDLHKDPALLSGGFQVRLNLAKAMVAEPSLLLLDEPTNYLDIVSIRWLKRFLCSWPGELMIITHDRGFMDSVSTHTMIIHRKKSKKVSGDTTKLYEQIALEEEIYEQTRLKDAKKRKETEVFINRFRAKARLASMVQSRIKALEKKGVQEKLDHIETLDFSFNAVPFHAKHVMDVTRLTFGFEPDKLLIQDLTITINKNDRIGVIGKNGKGKTTLLRLLRGELTPGKGWVKTHPRTEVAYFGQTNIDRLNKHNNIEEELKTIVGEDRKKVRDVCGAMMFPGDLALKKISVLSGGEKSRVLLGKLLLTPANLLLLDEPTNHLDMESCDSLIAAVDSFSGAAIVVTHDENFLHTLVNRLIVFDDNRVFVFEGSYQDYLDRVGWGNEPAPEHSEGGNRNESRKKKALVVIEHNKLLKPIEKRIKESELRIEKLEHLVAANNEKLVQLSAQGHGTAISELSIETHRLGTELADLYRLLDSDLKEHDRLDTMYQQQLTDL